MANEQEIHNVKILIVENQKIQAKFLENILTNAGYKHIHTTTNPSETIQIFYQFHPDLLLLDLALPSNDGFGVIRQLRGLGKEDYFPILALSSERGQEMRLKALEAGATDFLTKPFDDAEVLARIRNMIEMRILDSQVRHQNKVLEEKVQERTRELYETRLDIIRRLARAAEYRDNETGIHVIRMSRYCAKLGHIIGLSDSQCDLLLTASPLHDIGKIGIPDYILLKPGKLDPEEWEIMKTHTIIGAELLSGSSSPLMKMAEMIALTHHEQWEGGGYPRGLKGENIPLVGRISGLCDVFDALTSKRPYKAAWSVEDAVVEIKKESGKHFDPTLVEGFLKILPELKSIREEYPLE